MKEKEEYYLVQLKPFSDRNDKERIQKFQESAIKQGVCGMGWSDIGMFEKNEKIYLDDDSWNEHYNKYHNKYDEIDKNGKIKKCSGYRSFATALNIYYGMKIGEYVFTRLDNSECYIGKITRRAHHDLKKKKKITDGTHMSWFVNVKWKPIGQELNIPGSLQGLLARKFQNTAQRIPEDNMEIIKKLYESEKGRITLDENNFCSAFSSNELEDLVAFYIQDRKENKNYRIVPSTCKSNTKRYEYKLSNNNNRHILAQVKNQDAVIANNYLVEDKTVDKVYLFSGIGEYCDTSDLTENIKIIKRKDLFDYLKRDFNNKGYFWYLLKKFYTIKK